MPSGRQAHPSHREEEGPEPADAGHETGETYAEPAAPALPELPDDVIQPDDPPRPVCSVCGADPTKQTASKVASKVYYCDDHAGSTHEALEPFGTEVQGN